ncbi:MAG: hypothetical protein KGL38_03295 [Gemmatimonadota bacterium]|nr:hypothetical protein [Gemmatimonadota bacterium]MDE3127002.1 hypothetical protein [Gemmatimonadota bacterium]
MLRFTLGNRPLRLAAALLAATLLAACQEAPTTPIATEAAARPRGPSFALASSNDTTVLGDVTYGMLHGSIRYWNTGIAATQNGSHAGDTAFVQPGAAVRLTGNWQIGPVTNTGYCPGCIIEEYVAWIAPASGNGATPRNAGLWIGQTYFPNPNPGASGTFNWTTHAPTAEGAYYVGSGSSLDYQFDWWIEGGFGRATDNSTTAQAASFMVISDGTAPTITYAGNAGSYLPMDVVNITCTATDTLSGVASSSCADISGPAYTFAAGTNTFSATATDRAGNSGTQSTSFTVSVTAASVCSLIDQWVTPAGLANSLCVKLQHGDIRPFVNEVAAQTGKALTADQAAILDRLAASL